VEIRSINKEQEERMNSWYEQLIKPSWSPPAWLFGPVWTLLYGIILITFGAAVFLFIKSHIPWLILLPFVLNLIFNISFTPLQFGLRNNFLAFVDILLILITLIWAMTGIYKFAPWIALANIPYLLWVSFAAVLQGSITWLNR
jgi:translocator protein